MLKYHNVNSLEGKISMGLIDKYRLDCRNLQLASIIAGFHRSYGLRNEGISMSLEIVDHIMDDTDNIKERCLLVWNLYSLIDEFVEEEKLDEAMELACRAERNWSRDIILGDELGVYHVSWIEQIWHKQAEIFHLIGDKRRFEMLTDRIISSRLCFYEKAAEITGETIIHDRCAYSCLELMAFEERKRDMEKAVGYLVAAILMKGGTDYCIQNDGACDPGIRFTRALKYFFMLGEQSYDNIAYTYCCSCRHYSKDTNCTEMNLVPCAHHCCSKYSNQVSR